MNPNYQRSWPMPNDYYNQEVTDYSAYQAMQMPNSYYIEQSPYTQSHIQQSQMNMNQNMFDQMEYIQHTSPQMSYTMMDFQQPTQFITTPNRKGRQTVSKSVKRQRQLRRNERERERQGRLNSAFDVLRGSIPSFLAPYKHEQKLTQIETLILAKYYISSLKGMLEESELDSCDSEEDSSDICDSGKTRSESISSSEAGSV